MVLNQPLLLIPSSQFYIGTWFNGQNSQLDAFVSKKPRAQPRMIYIYSLHTPNRNCKEVGKSGQELLLLNFSRILLILLNEESRAKCNNSTLYQIRK